MYYQIQSVSKKIIISVSILLGIFILLHTFQPITFAQTDSLNLSAYPSIFDISTQPDTTVTRTIRIRNNSSTPTNLSITIKKLVPNPQDNLIIQDFTTSDAFQNWISFNKAVISALPNEWTDIQFTLTIPKDAAFGYYFVIYVQPQQQATTGNQPTAHLMGSIAIPVLLNVNKSGAIINGKMLSFVSNVMFSEYLPITFSTTFLNTGNIHMRPSGSIFIKDWTGKTVDVLTINANGGSIIPGETRSFATLWTNSFVTNDPIIEDGSVKKDKNGNPMTHLMFHWDHILNFRIGKYTAHAITVIPTAQRDISFESGVTFWIFPWKFVGITILIAILAGIGLVSTAKSLAMAIKKVFKR